MIRYRRLSLLVIAATSLGILGAGTALAAPQHGRARTAATKYGTLTINITDTGGTVWGTVSAKPLKKSCDKSKCTFTKIKIGTKITLTETPTDSSTWPFNGWTLNKKGAGSATTLTFKMAKTDNVTATYVVPGGTLTINITDTGTLWGKVKVEPLGTVCDMAKCTLKNVALGQALTLTETPTDESTWPFGGWTLNGSSKGTATTLQFNMASSDTVTTFYCDGSC